MSSPSLIAALLARGTPLMRRVFARAREHRLQILLSHVPQAGRDVPLHTHAFRADAEYFYPASTVKLCAAVAALRTLARLRAQTGRPVRADTPVVIHPCFADERTLRRDATNRDAGVITVAHEIRKACLVSDNPSHNRLLALIGHRELNHCMWQLGLKSVRLHHRLSEARTPAQNRRTGRVDLLVADGGPPLIVPARRSTLLIDNAGLRGLLVGRKHITPSGRPVSGPMPFLHKNRISLRDLHRLLLMVARPDLAPGLDLAPAHRAALLHALTTPPRKSRNPRYAARAHPDHRTKLLLPGLARVDRPSRWRITSKLGQAYGFTTENALVVHTPTGRAFALAATLYANASGIMNADTYDDTTVAEPFMADLGEAVGRWLLRREPRDMAA